MSIRVGEHRASLQQNQASEKEASSRLAAIVESSDDAIIGKNLDGIITSWNAAATRLFGYAPEEIIGSSVLKIVPPELLGEEAEILSKLRSGELVDHFVTQRMRKDGTRLDVLVSISPIRDGNGNLIGASKIARDISDRRRAEEARLRLAAIVEFADDAIIGKNLDGTITSWNASAVRLFGYQPEEIIGQSVLTLIPPELRHEEVEILRNLRAGQRMEHYETRRQRKDGTTFEVSLTISPVRDITGKVVGASKIARDISDRRRAEAALIQTEKLAAIGRMAAAIAHEVNNPLEAVTNLAYLLTVQPSLDEEARGYARLLLDEVGRASRITRQTLAFYRDSTTAGPVNLPEVLDSVLDLHHPTTVQKNIRVLRNFRAHDATVNGFASELRQVFANLILNAIDALPPRGGELHVKVDHGRRNRGEVRVTIADNGCGMLRGTREHIFQPFFTTKTGRGNGLGLWVSDGIVRKHGGRIRVHSSVTAGRSGSIFTVILPCSGEAAAVQRAA